jgi:hypothetical protein
VGVCNLPGAVSAPDGKRKEREGSKGEARYAQADTPAANVQRKEPRKEKKTETLVGDLWKALMVAIVAATGTVPCLSLNKRTHRDCLQALRSLHSWLRRTAYLSGPLHVVQKMKEFAADCRLAAIQGGKVPGSRFSRIFTGPLFSIGQAMRAHRRTADQRDILVQISHLGRSLPKGRTDKEGRAALRAHLDALGSAAPPLSKARREELVSFVKQWANEHLGQFTPKLEFEPTAGACL